MKCLILAAGYATRLYPLTENYPKPLLPVAGRPILEWLVEDLAPMIDEFAVISNHRYADHFRTWARTRPQKITVLDDGTTTNEGRLGAVRDILFAARELGLVDPAGTVGGEDGCLVMAGDNVLDFSLRDFVLYARETGTSCVMCHPETSLAALRRTAVITVAEGGLITSYEEKPREPKGQLAVPPFYYYRKEDLRRIPEALEAGCGTDAPGSLAAWLSARTPVHAWVMPGRRYDIGDRESYERVCAQYRGKTV